MLFCESPWLVAGLELFIAAMLATVAVTIRPGEAAHFTKTVRWAALIAAMPLFWLIMQLLPLPAGALSGSIWQSAGAALGTPIWSSITVDQA